MKNQALPLAAALILAAASSQAQLLNPAPGGSGMSFGPTSGGFSMTGGGSESLNVEMTYKCSTVPYRACTTAEMNYRQLAVTNRRCPAPVVDACAAFLMRNSVSGTGATTVANPAQGMDPLTMPDDFYKKCGTVPYRLCTPEEQAAQDAWKRGQTVAQTPTPASRGSGRYDEQPGFIGPPCPPDVCKDSSAPQSPPVDTAKALERMRDPKDRIDLGNNEYGAVDEGGETITICGIQGCRVEQADKYADKIQAKQKDASMFSGTSAGGTPPNTGGGGVPATGGGQEPAPLNPTRSGGGQSDANDVIAAQGAISRSMQSASRNQGFNPAPDISPKGGAQTVKIDGGTIKVDDIDLTFVGNQKVGKMIKQTGDDMGSGYHDEFVTTDGRTQSEVRGRRADVPLGPDGRPALTSADANSAPAP